MQQKKREMISPLVLLFREAWHLILLENVAGLFQNIPTMALGVNRANQRKFMEILGALLEKNAEKWRLMGSLFSISPNQCIKSAESTIEDSQGSCYLVVVSSY